MRDIEIRKATIKDLDGILAVEELSFSNGWNRKMFQSEFQNQQAHYFVVAYEGEIIAYGGIWLVLDEGHITNIAVAPQYRSKGIGTLLLQYLLQMALGTMVTTVTLEVRVSNTVARGLYKKFGFLEAGIRQKYYADNLEDAVLMVFRK